MLKDFTAENAVVIGVSPDDQSSHAKFVEKFNLSIELLSDPRHEVLERYGVWQKKKMYGKAFMGVVRSTYLIDPNGMVVKSWEKVNVNGHADAVKESLQEFKRGEPQR